MTDGAGSTKSRPAPSAYGLCERPWDIIGDGHMSDVPTAPASARSARHDGLDVTVRVPGSKSITNRALLLAALADGPSTLRGALAADDTRAFAAGLRALGFAVDATGRAAGACRAPPAASPPPRPTCTAPRRAPRRGSCSPPAPPARAVTGFDAAPQLRRRPLAQLLEALRAQGARTEPAGRRAPAAHAGGSRPQGRQPAAARRHLEPVRLGPAHGGAARACAAGARRRRPREPPLRRHDPAR